MKKSTFISIALLQGLLLSGSLFIGIKAYNVQKEVHATQESLTTTITLMDESFEESEQQKALFGPLEKGTEAPDFSLIGLDSQQVNLADYKGIQTLLMFADKNLSHKHHPYKKIKEIQQYRGDLEILLMYYEAIPEEIQSIKEQFDIPVKIVASTPELLGSYRISSNIMTSVLINEEGKIGGTYEHATYHLDPFYTFLDESCQTCTVN